MFNKHNAYKQYLILCPVLELTTALQNWFFHASQRDTAVVEAGLNGRLSSRDAQRISVSSYWIEYRYIYQYI